MSNPVFIVKPAAAPDSSKVLMRFFESSAASFEIENKVYQYAADIGMTPKVIDSDM
jgi:predicted Ser/Thr protein kinase